MSDNKKIQRSPDHPRTPTRKQASDGQIGDALRSVYERTIDEAVPAEMLDLLGKLG